MSAKAKATLATTVMGTIGIVYFVHAQQVADKAVSLASYSNSKLNGEQRH
jgi:hypothetical protein